MKEQIPPHGGELINRILEGKLREELVEKADSGKLKQLELSQRELCDLEMIANGAFSPLEGFMCEPDYENVVTARRLESGLPWTIPVVLSVSKEKANELKLDEDIALLDDSGIVLAVLHLEDIYHHNKDKEALEVYGTNDIDHPGVRSVYESGDMLLGGKISMIRRRKYKDFLNYRLDPIETRVLFAAKGWKRIVAFQTRNPVHRAHEYIQKCALEVCDALFLHPLVGETKKDDLPADVRIRSYEVVLEEYYPKDRVALAVLPASMRYAGPREAIFHALIRKNYGCTHFIVGRDHAGVGSYYGSFDAHYIFDQFEGDEIGITPLFFDHTFYCKRCDSMASYKTCPHSSEEHVILSGTKVREMLRAGKMPPPELTRREVAQVLVNGLSKVESYTI